MNDKGHWLEELDGRDVLKGNKKAKIESQVSRFGDSPMSQHRRGGSTRRRAKVSSLQGASSKS